MATPFVRTTVHRDVLTSTSDLARELVLDGEVALPLLVRADRQTAGRGRGSNAWYSDRGSLTFTLALDPAAHGLRAEHEPRLALASAVALIEAIGPILPTASAATLGIRWPNDVEASGRKLAGILPERIETSRGPRFLLGIGLNVRTRLDEAPPEVRRLATSVEALGGFGPGSADLVDALLVAILERLPIALQALARDDPHLPDTWAGLDALLGRPIAIDLGPRIVEGMAAGIEPTGGLRFETPDGPLVLFGGRVLRVP